MPVWYYTINGQQAGPIPQDALKQMFESGSLPRHERVWREGMMEWVAAASVAEFAGPLPLPPVAGPALEVVSYASPPIYSATPLEYGLPPAQSYQGLAIAGFVMTCACLMCGALGVVIGPTGGILGFCALRGMKKSGNPQGRGFAIAAIVIGSVEVVLYTCAAIFVVYAIRHK